LLAPHGFGLAPSCLVTLLSHLPRQSRTELSQPSERLGTEMTGAWEEQTPEPALFSSAWSRQSKLKVQNLSNLFAKFSIAGCD